MKRHFTAIAAAIGATALFGCAREGNQDAASPTTSHSHRSAHAAHSSPSATNSGVTTNAVPTPDPGVGYDNTRRHDGQYGYDGLGVGGGPKNSTEAAADFGGDVDSKGAKVPPSGAKDVAPNGIDGTRGDELHPNSTGAYTPSTNAGSGNPTAPKASASPKSATSQKKADQRPPVTPSDK
ncbi:MAG: hypothetical protein NVSMB1_19110 [Polyangiales bacterium]